MIARIWQGVTRAEDVDRYTAYVEETGLAGYRRSAGNRGAWILTRVSGDRAEFVTFSLWDSREAIEAFAGHDIDKAVFYPEDDQYLIERDLTVRHYEVASAGDRAGYGGPMAETQREPVPRADSGEADTALAFLSFARHCVLKKADGLSEEQLRRVLVGSGTCLLGLVQHLAEAERYWFGHHLGGAAWEADREHGMAVPADRAAADVLSDYRAAIEDSDRAIRAAGDPGARIAVPVEGNRHTLRWVLAHMTSETARHAGHADILREQLDGTTGR